jgi:hypothetical protein
MAKRFTDTNKYKKPFIRGLQGAYKLFWDYLYHDCDHAGIWIVDFEIAQLYLGQDMQINKNDALCYFNDGETRIIEFDNAKKWLIVPFIQFQYGELNEQNRVHSSVIMELKKSGIDKGLISSLLGAKDKDKDKDIDKEEEKRKRKPFKKPTIEEVRKYFHENGYKDEIAIKAFNSYDTANWFDSKGDPILSWKQKMINVWFRDEHKITKSEMVY